MQEEPDWRPAGSTACHGYHVAVEVAFIPERSHPNRPGWFYAYRIRIENRAGVEARLSERHWRITDATGAVHEVDGPGVVGQHPTLAPGSSFVYTSACPLPTPFGSCGVGTISCPQPVARRSRCGCRSSSSSSPAPSTEQAGKRLRCGLLRSRAGPMSLAVHLRRFPFRPPHVAYACPS